MKKFIVAMKVPAIIVGVLLLALAVTFYTLDSNLSSGIYPTDADSIAIPLFETAIALIIIFVPFFLAFVLTNFGFAKWRIAVVVGVFLYVACALLAALMAWSWFTPHHYSISTSYAIVIITALTLAVSAFRKRP